MLVDTDATIYTDKKIYHLCFMSQCHVMVAEYLQCGSNTEYGVVQLLVDLHISQQPNTHEKNTAFIHYHSPYQVNEKNPRIISFVLGDGTSLHNILGLSTILAIDTTITLQYTFVLQLDPQGKGLSDGGSLNESNKHLISPSIRSNISSAISILQSIAMDFFDSPTCQATSFDDIVLQDQIFQGSISRVLIYDPSLLYTIT